MYVKAIRTIMVNEWEADGLSIDQETLDSIFWAITLDGRRTFSSIEGAKRSHLDSLLTEVRNGAIVKRLNVPRDQLSPRMKRSHQQTGESTSGAGGSPSKKPRAGYGTIRHYHHLLKASWDKVVAASGGVAPMVKTVLGQVTNDEGEAYSLSQVSNMLGNNNCAVGHVTGVCNNANCTFDHDKNIATKNARQVAKVVNKAAADLGSEDNP